MRLALLALLCPSSALASGYYFSDSGVVALGRGGAFVASADTQYAQRYNPAGLIRIDRPTVNIGGAGVQQTIRFTRLNDDGTSEPAIDNGAPPFVVPQFGFATPIGDDFAFAFGFHSPYAPSNDYDPAGPQRYSVIETSIWQFNIGPSFAWRPIKQLTVGASLQWSSLRVVYDLKATTSGRDDPASDVRVNAKVADWFSPNANVGVLIEPHEKVSIGLNVQPPYQYSARGPASLDFTGSALESSLDQAVWTDDDVVLNLGLPMELRAGVAVRPREDVLIELAGTYSTWSSLDAITVQEVDVTVTGEIFGGPFEQEVPNELDLPSGFRNSWSVRLGGDYIANDKVTVRAGVLVDQGAMQLQELSPALVDTLDVQPGGGVSLTLADEHLRIDLSGAYIFIANATITDSRVTQINAYDEEGPALTVGNGTYETSGWVLAGQAQWRFGEARR